MIIWPVIPLFWIPVHGLPRLFRKLGLLTYGVPLITWLPLAYIIYSYRAFLLQYTVAFPLSLNLLGWFLLVSGSGLHIWTARLLGWGLIGVPEVSSMRKGKFVKTGAFSKVRHPTYFAHSLMFSGVFLITGSVAVGLLALIDLVVVTLIIIPLEDKELVDRFGDAYDRYIKEVPAFFPRISPK
jgi:protein-S-isoprenylcysteine O-methyltransferase Ste14